MTAELSKAELKRLRQAQRRRDRLENDIPEHVHGSWNGFINYGCREQCCIEAAHEYKARRRARRKQSQ